MCTSHLFSLLLVCVATPCVVQGCSCREDAFSVSRSSAIRSEFCSSYTRDAYIGMVIGATCNCIPGDREGDAPSAFLNCQDYQLNEEQNLINTTILTQGQCDFEMFAEDLSSCSNLGNVTGVNVIGPVATGELLNLTNPSSGCRYSCPFNVADDYPYVRQPCVYTVRVMEAFKGNYSVADVVEVTGPDVLTSCGQYGRVLQLNTAYVAGIGQACSPISQWGELSDYSEGEMELLRRLREGEEECGATATATVASVAMVMTFALFTVFM